MDDIASSALSGGDLGGDIGANAASSGLSPAGWGALGTGALALGGLGFMAAGGPTNVMSIPGYAQANAMVPGFQQQAAQTYGQGQALVSSAADAYARAQRGELTPEQAAQLQLTKTGEENMARQMYATMGRDFNKDTSAISTQQNIDATITAQAQQYIQSTIALATSQMGAGTQLIGASAQESSAATNILMQEGQAQIAANKSYSDSLTSAFASVAKIAGAVLPLL